MRATLKDIANKTNTSIRTVCRVINNSGSVKETTKNNVLKALKDLNYEPNLLAKSLKTNKSMCIGVIYMVFGSEMFHEIIQSIESITETYNHSIIVTNSNLSLEQENKNINALINRMIDGIIIFPSSLDLSYIKRITDLEIPLVTVGYVPENMGAYCTYFDDRVGMIKATEYLINKGHKNIVFININVNCYPQGMKLKAYADTLAKHKIKYNPDLVFETGPFLEEGYKISKEIFSKNLNFTSIICWNDQTATGVLKYCREKNIKIPDDYSIMGYDNDENISPYLNVPLTTINLKKKEIGKLSAKLLFDQINKNKIKEKRIILEPAIVERESVKNIVH